MLRPPSPLQKRDQHNPISLSVQKWNNLKEWSRQAQRLGSRGEDKALLKNSHYKRNWARGVSGQQNPQVDNTDGKWLPKHQVRESHG